MKLSIQLLKWLLIPALIVLAQIVLNANDALHPEGSFWSFIASSLGLLLVWRHRLEKHTLECSGDMKGIANDGVYKGKRIPLKRRARCAGLCGRKEVR